MKRYYEKEKGQPVPVSYQATVWIGKAALRREPEAGLEIVDILQKGDVVDIVAEQDGFLQLKNGLWIFKYAVKRI